MSTSKRGNNIHSLNSSVLLVFSLQYRIYSIYITSMPQWCLYWDHVPTGISLKKLRRLLIIQIITMCIELQRLSRDTNPLSAPMCQVNNNYYYIIDQVIFLLFKTKEYISITTGKCTKVYKNVSTSCIHFMHCGVVCTLQYPILWIKLF